MGGDRRKGEKIGEERKARCSEEKGEGRKRVGKKRKKK